MRAAAGESERILDRQVTIGQPLTPIGEWMGEFILLVAADGRVFAETTVQVLWVGDDLHDDLQRLIVADSSPLAIDT